MKEDFRLIKLLLTFSGKIVKKTYKFNDDTYDDWKYLYFFFYQRILLFNFHVPWPVHYTSFITSYTRIKFGSYCSPGSSPFQYIQGENGINLGDNVQLAPGVCLISSNHSETNILDHKPADPIIIGSNVWIGAHAVVLPGVKIGENTIIGAGSIVTKDIPANCVAAGNPCKVIRMKQGKVDV